MHAPTPTNSPIDVGTSSVLPIDGVSSRSCFKVAGDVVLVGELESIAVQI